MKEKESEERIQREITQKVERKKEGGKGVNDISSDPDANLILVLTSSPSPPHFEIPISALTFRAGGGWIGERYSQCRASRNGNKVLKPGAESDPMAGGRSGSIRGQDLGA